MTICSPWSQSSPLTTLHIFDMFKCFFVGFFFVFKSILISVLVVHLEKQNVHLQQLADGFTRNYTYPRISLFGKRAGGDKEVLLVSVWLEEKMSLEAETEVRDGCSVVLLSKCQRIRLPLSDFKRLVLHCCSTLRWLYCHTNTINPVVSSLLRETCVSCLPKYAKNASFNFNLLQPLRQTLLLRLKL